MELAKVAVKILAILLVEENAQWIAGEIVPLDVGVAKEVVWIALQDHHML